MDLKYSAEEQLLSSSVKEFARDYLRDARARSLSSIDGVDRGQWRIMLELGWLAAGVSDECGGLGGSITDSLLIHEGMGSGLVLEPLLTVSLGVRLMEALLAREEAQAALQPYLLGEKLCAVAHEEPEARGDLTFVRCAAIADRDSWTLQGCKCMVLGAPSADLLLVSARAGPSQTAPVGVFTLTRAQFAERLKSCTTLDGQRAADLDLAGLRVTAAARLGSDTCALPALAAVFDRALLETCADALGAMGASIELTAEHLKNRKQFGSPLSSFQSLQHKLADMVIAAEQARSILLFGATGIESGAARLRGRAVSAARVRVSESARIIGAHAVQLHGGIGVTEEHIISHYYRRLAAFVHRFGGTEWHVERFMAADN
jgi:alkylation response protein AidB-like acyl-CoA dehydrogenase